MYQAFEADVMDDLFYDAAEGPAQARRSAHAYDAYDEYDDSFDEYDEYDGYDEYDAGDDALDAFEDEMADALEAEDADEFLRRVSRGIRSAARVARQVGRGVGSVARVVAPIASAIPLPQAQAIARVANIAGRVLADGGDEFEAIDALVDLADAEDLLEAAAPAIATLALHGTMPQVARLPQPARRQLVQVATQATQQLAQRQGTPAARAIVPILTQSRQALQQRRIPARALPQAIQQGANRVARSPQMTRRLTATARSMGTRQMRRTAGMRGAACPNCGGSHRCVSRGPM